MAVILGIETSCDETAAALVEDGRRILSNVISSQFDVHAAYGGVVPELASRAHLERIVPVVREAFEQGGRTYDQVDAVAVTCGPGLIGSLLVGVTYAKSLSLSTGLPLLGINHLEGHIHACRLEEAGKESRAREIELPAVALVVSGGHTSLYRVEEDSRGKDRPYRYGLLGRTLDDAAGEAYDKVAKLLGLGYPGGPVLDRLAAQGDSQAVQFTSPNIKRGRPFDFSFSGWKTAVRRYVEQNGLADEAAERARTWALKPGPIPAEACSRRSLDLMASFQECVARELTRKVMAAAEATDARSVLLTGGVAANSRLREMMAVECRRRGLPTFVPSVRLSTDNAAMIAAAAFPRFRAGEFAGAELNASASLPLEG